MASDHNDSGSQKAPALREHLIAQLASLLDVTHAVCRNRKRSPVVVLTLGETNGGVKLVALPAADGWTLLRRLAELHGVDGQPNGTNKPYVPTFARPCCLRRAKKAFAAQRTERMLRDLKKAIPSLAGFVEAELDALAASITRVCPDPKTAKRLVARLQRTVLVAVDTARIDT